MSRSRTFVFDVLTILFYRKSIAPYVRNLLGANGY